MGELELLLARHGQTDWNLERRWQGRSDVPLNPTGRQQAEGLGELLQAERLDRALMSPLLRARETAQAVLERRAGPPFELEPRLTEMDPGDWEGRYDRDLEDQAAYAAWQADPIRSAPPGGESGMDVARRVAPFLDELAVSPRGGRILLVGHQFCLAILACLVSGTPLSGVRSHFLASCEVKRMTLPLRRPQAPPHLPEPS